jgi:hypothetical protein
MTSGQLTIKPGLSWFPAPREWHTLLARLSDGAFKLFVYLCLNADRTTARVGFRQAALAGAFGKSRRSLGVYLRELQANHVCRVTLSPNQHAAGTIQIEAPYWPYEWEAQPTAASEAAMQEAYVQAIAKYLQARACVRCRFSVLDRQLAEKWFQQGMELWHIEQAILMGCGRKYVSWLNGADSPPIGSLRYFKDVVEEVRQTRVSSEYWEFNQAQVKRLEQKWLASKRVLSTVPEQIVPKQNAER